MASQKDKLIAEALKLVEKGQYERAVKIYLKVVSEDESDIRIWLKIGDLYTKLRRNGEAAETYQHVARAYSEQGFYTKAIAVYKQILKLDPSLVKVHERLADLYKQMGLLPDAIDQFTQVAAAHQRDGRTRDALASFKQIVELDPQNVASRVKLAELYSREQMVREAIDEFAKAAEYLHEQGRVDDYMKVAERLLFHSPDNRPVSRELARLYLQKGDARRALPRLQVCFKADPRDSDTLALLAETFQALGQTVKAVSVLKELARIHAENGNGAERTRTWRRVLDLDPNDAEARAVAREATASRPRAETPPPSRPAPSIIVSDSLIAASPLHTGGNSGRISAPVAVPVPEPASQANTSSAVRSMPAFDLMVATAAQAQRAGEPQVAALDEKAVGQILAETEVFAKYNLHAKAIEHVRSVFERNPDHVAAREKLRTLLIASGRKDEAITELRLLARQTEGSAREARYLDEILSLAPGDEWALARQPAAIAARSDGVPVPMAVADSIPVHIDVDLDGEDVAESHTGDREVAAEPELDAFHLGLGDDGFDSAAPGASHTDEFAVVVEDLTPPPPAMPGGYDIEDRFGVDLVDDEAAGDPDAGVPDVAMPVPAMPEQYELGPELDPRTALGSDELEDAPAAVNAPAPDAVDNFDFSSFDDPQPATPALVTQQPAPDADAPVWLAAPLPDASVAAVEGEDDEPTGDVDVAMPAPFAEAVADTGGLDGPDASEAVASGVTLEDELEEADFYLQQGMVDEAREAFERLLADHPGHPLVLAKLHEIEPATTEATVAMSMDDMVAELAAAGDSQEAERGDTTAVTPVARQVVEASVGEDDFESHFDLGIGCKEMGLFDQAITEFKHAMRDPAREVQCQQMIGLCFLAKGQTHEAVRHFKQGLYAEGIREDEELALYYELGQSYERLSDRTEAIYYFERIRKRKARYRDIERRLEALQRPGAGDDTAEPAALQRK